MRWNVNGICLQTFWHWATCKPVLHTKFLKVYNIASIYTCRLSICKCVISFLKQKEGTSRKKKWSKTWLHGWAAEMISSGQVLQTTHLAKRKSFLKESHGNFHLKLVISHRDEKKRGRSKNECFSLHAGVGWKNKTWYHSKVTVFCQRLLQNHDHRRSLLPRAMDFINYGGI